MGWRRGKHLRFDHIVSRVIVTRSVLRPWPYLSMANQGNGCSARAIQELSSRALVESTSKLVNFAQTDMNRGHDGHVKYAM